MAIKAKNFLLIVFPTILCLFLGVFLIFSTAKAKTNYTTIWGSHYPYSGTYGAMCLICHSDNLELLNSYGKDICLTEDADVESRIVAVEDLDSDGDGVTNLEEIESDNQPGWKEGDNPLYHSDTCEDAQTSVPAPTIVPSPYRPPMDFYLFIPLLIIS
jgi:hypothetical protein